MVGSKCKGDVSTIRIVVYCQVDETGKIRYKCKKWKRVNSLVVNPLPFLAMWLRVMQSRDSRRCILVPAIKPDIRSYAANS